MPVHEYLGPGIYVRSVNNSASIGRSTDRYEAHTTAAVFTSWLPNQRFIGQVMVKSQDIGAFGLGAVGPRAEGLRGERAWRGHGVSSEGP